MEERVYNYGPGKYPPLMVGRDALIRGWDRMLANVSADGRDPADDTWLSGPRGVGKTCTMTAFARRGQQAGFEVINLQAVPDRPTLISSLLRQADSAIREGRGPWQRAKDAFERLASAQLGVGVLNLSVDLTNRDTPPAASQDPESLASALAQLARAARDSHPHATGGLMLTVDELQVATHTELSTLAATLQRLNVDHNSAPVAFVSTGLPHTPKVLRAAKVTHPERLLREVRIPIQLHPDDARVAIIEPAKSVGVTWDQAAVEAVLTASNCYPAHLQFFARAVWEEATGDHVTASNADEAIPRAIDALTETSLGPDWDTLSDRQAELLTAVAAQGGRAQVTHLERVLGRGQKDWSRPREDLIRQGLLYAPRRGELAVAVPSMTEYALANYPALQASSTNPLQPLQRLRSRGITNQAPNLGLGAATRRTDPPARPDASRSR